MDIYVYETENKVVGYMLIKEVSKKESSLTMQRRLLIDEIGVSKVYQRRGIGKKLYEYARELAKELGVDAVELTVWNFNKDAVKFYESIGMNIRRYTMEEII